MKKLILILLVSGSVSQALAGETYGLMMIVKGQVQVAKLKEQPMGAKVGTKVYPQDTIITGKDSRAKIVMSDRNIINVLPDTKLRIDQYISELKEKNVRLSLIEGKVRTNVEQKYDNNENRFEIKTPSAVVGVRGTQFATSYKRATNVTAVTTFRGEVIFRGLDALSNKQTEAVMVRRGETSENFDGKQPGTPVKMNPVEFKRVDKDTAVRKEDRPLDPMQAGPPKNDIGQIIAIKDRNDNLLGDSAKNIISKPAQVNIIIER
ncbi:FecR domain-containing protein [Pseudobdellovibrio sp. HCB154]|uniref:FecR family protein n=1 Tax=Pseudobdellovibrio sp. HCB154 TaxID=3386277 RepID=UPI00391708E4